MVSRRQRLARRLFGLDVTPELVLSDPDRLARLVKILRDPIAGGAANLLAGVTTATAGVALTTAAASLFGSNPLVLSTPVPQPQLPNPWGLAFCQVPDFTAIAAGASVTTNLYYGQLGTQIAQTVDNNQGASSATVGGCFLIGLIPPAGTTISAASVLSSGTGTAAAAAGSPLILGALSFV